MHRRNFLKCLTVPFVPVPFKYLALTDASPQFPSYFLAKHTYHWSDVVRKDMFRRMKEQRKYPIISDDFETKLIGKLIFCGLFVNNHYGLWSNLIIGCELYEKFDFRGDNLGLSFVGSSPYFGQETTVLKVSKIQSFTITSSFYNFKDMLNKITDDKGFDPTQSFWNIGVD